MVTKDTDVPSGSAPEQAKVNKPDRKRLLIVIAVVVLAAIVLFLANRDEPAPAAKDDSSEMVAIEDRDDGFAMDLPGNWVFLEQEQEDPQIRMVVGEEGAPQNHLRVRVSPLPQPVVVTDDTPDNVVAELQGQFDQYIDNGENVRDVIQRQRVKINGTHGWWYLYSFNNAGGEEEGVHSHFFMLGGDKLYTLVFQVLPAKSYGKYAGTFDEMISSFRVLDAEASPAASPAG